MDVPPNEAAMLQQQQQQLYPAGGKRCYTCTTRGRRIARLFVTIYQTDGRRAAGARAAVSETVGVGSAHRALSRLVESTGKYVELRGADQRHGS